MFDDTVDDTVDVFDDTVFGELKEKIRHFVRMEK